MNLNMFVDFCSFDSLFQLVLECLRSDVVFGCFQHTQLITYTNFSNKLLLKAKKFYFKVYLLTHKSTFEIRDVKLFRAVCHDF